MATGKRRPPSRRSPRAARSAQVPATAAADARDPGDPHSGFELSNEEIERALKTGEHAGLLEDYFGPEEYAQLRQLSRDASSRSVRGGPRVLVLPGIMGSKIGRRGAIFDDVYWFDPVDVAAGRLARLALEEPGSAFDELGPMLVAYLKLKLRLQMAGYDAELLGFDWRRGIPTLGRQFAEQLKRRGGREVFVVAHSMGGLVARWALGAGGAQCRRLVMLGTPNYGSFAPVMALRATYPVVRKVGAVDLRHTPEQLARDVFSTFPGLTQMLPWPEKFGEVNLYDLASWPLPDDGLRPRPQILAGVQAVHAQLARGDDRMVLIAGVDQRTVTGLRRGDDGGFEYEYSLAGDGTVPLDFARLPGVTTYYAVESHGSLPNNRTVAQAVVDLLDGDATDALPRTYAGEERRGVVERVAESALRVDPYPGRRGAALSQRELRTVLEEVAAPTAREPMAAAAAPVVRPVGAAPDATASGFGHPLEGVVVGRRRQHRIDLRFARGSITEADTRALALGVFRDVAPSGAARAIDERLGGVVTELSRRRMFSGGVGEIFILPTGRHALTADYIAFVGLGSFDRFNDEVLQTAAENLIRTFVNTRIEEFATVLFGAGSGERPASALRNLLAGFIRGLCDADKKQQFRRIVICEQDAGRYTDIKAEFYRLSSTPLCQEVEFTFDEETLRAPPEITDVPRRLQSRVDPAYLIVRQERAAEDGSTVDVRTSVLTAGARAAVVSGVREVRTSEFEALRRRLVRPGADLAGDGPKLAGLLLADAVRAVLPLERERHLVVVHDAPMSRVPWETIALPHEGVAWTPALARGISHRYTADNLAVAKWLEERRRDDVLNVLLVADPTEDLDGAKAEGRRVEALFGGLPGCRLDALWGKEATRPAVLSAFASGKYDVIHYAGHAFFDERHPERSGLLCHGKVSLTGADVAGLGRLPSLVFFNACESVRVRGGGMRDTRPRHEQVDRHVSVAEALMRGGVASFLGTYWPVEDAAATVFANAFYRGVVDGRTLGESIQAGRLAVRETRSNDWADYVFYGNADFVLKEALESPLAASGAAAAATPAPTAATAGTKTAAKKAPAKKTAAKKTTAKKTTAKQTAKKTVKKTATKAPARRAAKRASRRGGRTR